MFFRRLLGLGTKQTIESVMAEMNAYAREINSLGGLPVDQVEGMASSAVKTTGARISANLSKISELEQKWDQKAEVLAVLAERYLKTAEGKELAEYLKDEKDPAIRTKAVLEELGIEVVSYLPESEVASAVTTPDVLLHRALTPVPEEKDKDLYDTSVAGVGIKVTVNPLVATLEQSLGKFNEFLQLYSEWYPAAQGMVNNLSSNEYIALFRDYEPDSVDFPRKKSEFAEYFNPESSQLRTVIQKKLPQLIIKYRAKLEDYATGFDKEQNISELNDLELKITVMLAYIEERLLDSQSFREEFKMYPTDSKFAQNDVALIALLKNISILLPAAREEREKNLKRRKSF